MIRATNSRAIAQLPVTLYAAEDRPVLADQRERTQRHAFGYGVRGPAAPDTLRAQLDLVSGLRVKSRVTLDPGPFNALEPGCSGLPEDHQRIAALIEATGRDPEIVLYPASGIDADGVTGLFPGAIDYVAMDKHPFYVAGGPLAPPPEVLAGQHWNAWQSISAVTERSGACSLLATRLRQQGFRITRMDAFFEDRKRVKWLSTTKDVPVCSGVIEFDRGPGTPVRRYWHLDLENEWGVSQPGHPYSADGIYAALDLRPPDAMLVKGAMGALSRHDLPRGDLPARALQWLTATRGILVEGAHTTGKPEFFKCDARSEPLLPLMLSYAPGVRINRF